MRKEDRGQKVLKCEMGLGVERRGVSASVPSMNGEGGSRYAPAVKTGRLI